MPDVFIPDELSRDHTQEDLLAYLRDMRDAVVSVRDIQQTQEDPEQDDTGRRLDSADSMIADLVAEVYSEKPRIPSRIFDEQVEILFGKIQAVAFTGGTTVTITPCTSDGTLIENEDAIAVHLAPDASTVAVNYAVDTVLRYLPYSDEVAADLGVEGVLMGLWPMPDVADTSKTYVWMHTPTGVYGWVEAVEGVCPE